MTEEPEQQKVEIESGVGSLLRASRERMGEDLRDIAEALRIRYPYLKAVEAGAYDELPGATYAVGFIRSYADYLGLDADEVVRRYKKELEGQDLSGDLVFPTPISEGKVPSGALILVGVALAILAYVIWYSVSSSDQEEAAQVSKVPTHLSDKVEKPAEKTTIKPVVPVVTVVPVDSAKVAADATKAIENKNAEEALKVKKDEAAPLALKAEEEKKAAAAKKAEELKKAEAAKVVEAAKKAEVTKKNEVSSAPEKKPTEPTPSQPEKTQPEKTQPEKTQPEKTKMSVPGAEPVQAALEPQEPDGPREPRVYGGENTGARIILTSIGDSWVEIRDGEEIILTRLLHDGDTYFVPNRPGLVMNTGNAGSVSLEVDGAKVPSVGKEGEVMFNVPLDPALLREGKTRDN